MAEHDEHDVSDDDVHQSGQQLEALLDELSLADQSLAGQQLQTRLRSTRNQVLILQHKHKTAVDEIKSLRKELFQLRRERLQAKKQFNRIEFERDAALNAAKCRERQVTRVQHELEQKNALLTRVAADQRRHERRKSDAGVGQSGERKEESAADGGTHVCTKTLTLQRLLLCRARELADRDVTIEELRKRNAALAEQSRRLSGAKRIAEQLTAARHQLHVTANALDRSKQKNALFVKQNETLKQKLLRTSIKL